MEKTKKIKLFIGLSYLVLVIIFLSLFFSKFSLQEITSYDFIKENRLYFLKFKSSNLYISAIPPVIIGFIIGILASIMGVGGGFILIPAMIYILGMPTKVVIGTSLYQIMFITAFTTFMHATQNKTVDLLLALILIVGGVLGAQLGARVTVKLKAEEIRILLAIIVLLVCLKLALDLMIAPDDLFSITYGSGS